MSLKRHVRKALKIIGIFVGSLLILLTVFHFWFVHHAEEIIEDLVAAKSNGKLKLEVKKFRFNWLSKKMELEDAVFYSTDSATAGTSYRFAVKKINLRVKAVLPILFKKKVMINMLDLQDPDIIVTRLRSNKKDTLKDDREDKDVSIPQEMGKIYKSIQDALHVLQVKKFQIENARFQLVNKIRPGDVPVTIGHIDFHIDNLRIDTGRLTGNEKIFFSDNIVLKSRDQDILLPDGRHRISYRKFRINIEKRIVEFDSCTIAALKTGNAATDFSIYFDALVMTNIDFDTLYRAEIIKADSVYCVNPHFKLNVDLGKRTGPRKAPKLDQIIRQLTGDMSLNFVVVNNASFDINTIRDGVPNSYTSRSNNFEIQGLHVNNDAAQPLRIEKLAMAIRNYENFFRDSMYALQFDSIIVNNDKIFLNNFSFQKRVNGKTVNNFKVPRFQLTGLSWDDLLFQQKLTAQEATLYNPIIDYTESTKKKSEKKYRNIFDALASINDVIMLEDMNIVNGNIDIKLAGNIRMQLRNATMAIESRALLGSEKLSGIRRSVNHLDFNTGYFKINDFTVSLDSIYYTGQNSRLNAGRVTLNNRSKSVEASLHNVTMDEIFINEANGDVSISGINWQEADIKLLEPPGGTGKNQSFISLTDINGNNTRLVTPLGKGKTASVFINHLGMIAFLLKPGEQPIIGGLDLSAQDLSIKDAVSALSVATLGVTDQQKAFFEDLRYKKITANDTIDVNIPLLSFVPNIQPAIAGEVYAGNVRLVKPVARIHITQNGTDSTHLGLHLPKGNITNLVIEQPDIRYSQQGETGTATIYWQGSKHKDNAIVVKDAAMEGSSFTAKQFLLSLNNFIYSNKTGKTFDAGRGEITASLEDISFQKHENEEASWKTTLRSLDGKDFQLDSLGKRNGRFWINTVQLKDLALGSSSISSVRKIVAENKTFQIRNVTGGYADSNSRFGWYNVAYDKGSKLFSLDSFHLLPTPSRDSFVAKQKYQADYIQLRIGATHIGPFDIDRYLADTIVSIGMMRIDDISFDDYRDNRLPFRSGVIKPLVTDAIKRISFKLSVDTVLLNNANIIYTEVNPKTNQAGIIPFTRMTLRAFPVRNFDLGPTDSLYLQANGYLMDSVGVRLRMRASYTDTLSGFLLTVRMNPADMRVLNPVLAPLASAKLRSGYLDTLSMRVAGGEYLSYGEMKLFYHDLKLELYKPGTVKRNAFLTFLANSFLVKNRNTRRTSNVFYVRNRERSAVNYLIKTVMSGVNPGIGIKSNRKIMRQYKKELRQRNLPPVDYD